MSQGGRGRRKWLSSESLVDVLQSRRLEIMLMAELGRHRFLLRYKDAFVHREVHTFLLEQREQGAVALMAQQMREVPAGGSRVQGQIGGHRPHQLH